MDLIHNQYIIKAQDLAKQYKKTLIVVAALYALRYTNSVASSRARNNAVTDTYDWDKEVVVVTGGSSGIGECLVKRLAMRRIKVVILDLAPPSVKLHNVLFIKCDITKKEEVAAAGRQITSTFGPATILINNAGVVRNAPILKKESKDIDFTFSVNAFSHYNTVQEFVPDMIAKKHGHIITTSSLAAFLSSPNVSDYNMSKAAVTAFHESLGTELKHIYHAPKVRTSIIHPSYVQSPLHKDKAFGTENNPLLKSALKADEVAERIERVVLGGESKTVIVPENLGFIAGSRGFTEWLFRYFMDASAKASLTI